MILYGYNILVYTRKLIHFFIIIIFFTHILYLCYQNYLYVNYFINTVRIKIKFNTSDVENNLVENTKQSNKHNVIIMSVYRDNNERICGIIITPIINDKEAYNLLKVNYLFNCDSSLVCVSSDKHVYTREIINYIKEYADLLQNQLVIYVYDARGIDTSLLFDISFFNSHFIRIKDVPIGFDNCIKASMICYYQDLKLIEFRNLNYYMEDSMELIFDKMNIEFDVSYDEIVEYIHYGILKEKKKYIFYYHVIVSLYANQNIINKKI